MSTDPQKTFYVTTPIYYVNARPHIGHVYTTVIADVMARYHRLRGDDTFFLTGTDEHGKKVADAAQENGVNPQEYTDQISAEFRGVFDRYRISHDDFIRTTESRHKERATRYIKQLIDQGDVYLGEYEGWYDQGQEEYVTENNAREQDYKSVISGKALTRVKEKNYFFRLSKYQDAILDHIESNPAFIQPNARRNEVLSRVRGGLNDIAISRSTEPWGIPMPGDPEHSIYVWIDALFNYLTATEANGRPELWPAQLHLIGKEILWFHAVIWPAMLMAIDKPLFGRLYAHSYWISDGKKMSKTLGNFVDLPELDRYVDKFGLDALRWYFATQGPLSTTDSDFTETKFIEVYNSDLANTFGNSVSRVSNMIGKYFDGILPKDSGHTNGYDPRVQAGVAPIAQLRSIGTMNLSQA
ncbi:MAG: methionine--tRNA ligase, partial [Planctomycetota bacterium]